MEVFPVNSRKRSGVTLKGFTVLEMLIVIAIIGILASMASIAAGAFIRSAKIREANANAEAVYHAVQDWLVDMEVSDEDIGSGYGSVSINSIAGAPEMFEYATPTSTGASELKLVGQNIISGSWRAQIDNAGQYKLRYVLWSESEAGGRTGFISQQISSEDQEKDWLKDGSVTGCYPLKASETT